jgi:nucleoside-diphosphate-sugar epimerase
MRIALTGGSGFIGRELMLLLAAAGHEVHLLGRSGTAPVGTVAHRLDLLHEDPAPVLADLRPDTLVHLAWIATPGLFWNAPENLDWMAASLRLARAFAAAGGTRLVVAGTCAEYDWSYHRLEEARTPLKPHTLYGTAKARLFQTLGAAASTLGLSLAWGRIFFPYGPHEAPNRLLSGLIDGLAAGHRVSCSAGLQRRDFLHVSDVAAGFALLAESRVEGAVNIASGRLTAVRDVIAETARLVGRPDLVDFGARPTQTGEPHIMAADVTRIRQIGFAPRFDLGSGLVDTVSRRLSALQVAPANVSG